jgi:hypothetical protein
VSDRDVDVVAAIDRRLGAARVARKALRYTSQVHIFRALALIVPLVVFVLAKNACDGLRRTQVRPALGGPPRRVRRRDDGGFDLPRTRPQGARPR